MAANVALAGNLPKSDLNGLTPMSDNLTGRGKNDVYAAVVLFRTQKVTEKVADGEVYPTVQIVAVEPLDGDDDAAARKLMEQAYMGRTGKMALDLDNPDAPAPDADDPDED